MEQILKYDPDTQFELLETIEDFEEEVRRPESLRFYTLDEQLQDFFQKKLPARRPTLYEMEELKRVQQRVHDLYNKFIIITDSDYRIDTTRKEVNVDWIVPIYGEHTYKKYDFNKEWVPLFNKESRFLPNFYNRLLPALPNPFVNSSQDGLSVTSLTELVNNEGKESIRVVGAYYRTVSELLEDGTMILKSEGIPNTNETIRSVGYYLKKRTLELPSPLIEHPFLKSTNESVVLSDRPLLDIYPGFSAIMEHAVPITIDPYRTAKPYLKEYDVKLNEIEWSLWKSKFPSAEIKHTPTSVKGIVFPPHDKKVDPSTVLTETYSIPWNTGLHSRLWLSKQADNGLFVAKLFMSKVSESGLTTVPPPIEAPESSYPVASAEICMNLTSDFDTFISSGLFRPPGICIPIGMIHKERSDALYAKRIGWKEPTEHKIVSEYTDLLKLLQPYEPKPLVVKYEKAPGLRESERRKDMLSILKDTERLPPDRADAIEKILTDLELKGSVYFDLEGLFVICSHTLEIERGVLRDNRLQFYIDWTTTIEGKRVCVHCGEQVNNDVFVAVDEYDDSGHLVMTYESLTSNLPEHAPVSGLEELKSEFELKNNSEVIFFLLLSLLRVIPNKDQLKPLILKLRTISTQINNSPGSSKQKVVAEGMLAVGAMTILLQAHDPFLIPERTMGPIPDLTGFPRDSDEKETQTIDFLLKTLRIMYANYGSSSSGSIVDFFKHLLSKDNKSTSNVVTYLNKFFVKDFKELLESAKDRYVESEAEITTNMIVLPIEHVGDVMFSPGTTLGKEEHSTVCNIFRTSVILTSTVYPSVFQSEVELSQRIEPSLNSKQINRVFEQPKLESISKDYKSWLKHPVPKEFESVFKENPDGTLFVSIASRLLDLLPATSSKLKELSSFRSMITFLNTTSVSASDYRDMAKAMCLHLLHEISKDKSVYRDIQSKLKSDLGMKMLLVSKKMAEQEDKEKTASERALLKQRYRSMTDQQRELQKSLTDLGIGAFIITNEDREEIANQEMNDIPTEEDLEGYGQTRDVDEQGEQPLNENGVQMEVDHGNYTDRSVLDYNEYTTQDGFPDE
jgi:hypothetical protein